MDGIPPPSKPSAGATRYSPRSLADELLRIGEWTFDPTITAESVVQMKSERYSALINTLAGLFAAHSVEGILTPTGRTEVARWIDEVLHVASDINERLYAEYRAIRDAREKAR